MAVKEVSQDAVEPRNWRSGQPKSARKLGFRAARASAVPLAGRRIPVERESERSRAPSLALHTSSQHIPCGPTPLESTPNRGASREAPPTGEHSEAAARH